MKFSKVKQRGVAQAVVAYIALLTAAAAQAQSAPAPAAPIESAPSAPAAAPATVPVPQAEPLVTAPIEAAPLEAATATSRPSEPPVEPRAPADAAEGERPAQPVETSEEAEAPWSDAVTLSGYAEAYYSHNFAKPENGITNNRWLDEKHNSFTLQTVVLDVAAEKGPVSAKLTLMFGPTADRWYFEGAQVPASETGVYLNPAKYSNETWKHIQTAYVAYRAPVGEGLVLQGGLMPTQVGYEGAAIKDNWNWSRSNLFNYLPFFHVGLRATYPVSDSLSLTAAVYNGWNQASDLNKAKTISLQSSLLRDEWLFNLLYLGGFERAKGQDPAGEPWRNLFDAVVQYDVLPMLSLGTNLDGGFERNDLGVQSWFAAALYARAKATDWLYFALRGDGIFEQNAERNIENASVTSPILLGGSDHILSGTVTAELRPIDGVSFRLEYRHDDSDADVPLFYTRGFDAAGLQRTSSVQNTLTLGMTGWF